MARVLVCDDSPDWRADLVEQVRSFGHRVEAVATVTELRARLPEGWDALLLDQRLTGDGGPDDGLDAIAGATALGVRVLVVTGFASNEGVQRAYDAGAWDYVEKRSLVFSVLRLKLRQLADASLAWGTVALDQQARRLALAEAHRRVTGAASSAERGLALEELAALLAGTIPGFVVRTNTRTTDEELDLVARNESTDPFWAKFGPYVLFECKNRKTPTEPRDFDRLRNEVGRRYGTANLAFFVSMGGFTAGVRTTAEAIRETGPAIVLVDDSDLAELVVASDPNVVWKRLVDRHVAGR